MLKVGWRNIFRNRRRSLITVVALMLNTAVLIVTFALMEGMAAQLNDNVTNLTVGEAQVHAPGYRKDRSIYKSIDHAEDIVTAARAAGADAVRRTYGYGLVSRGSKSAGGRFWGIAPAAERATFELADRLAAGRFVADEAAGEVVLGSKLAKSLHAEPGSELVAVVQAADGSLGNELYTVVGVLQIAGEEIDRTAIMLHEDDFEELFVTGGRVHEIALTSHRALTPEQLVERVADAAGEAEVMTWAELLPSMNDMLNLSRGGAFIFSVIFFLAAGFGVLNTMLMATHDRVREYGVIKALGATPWRIVRDVSAEALLLALLSAVIGSVVGVAAAAYFNTHPIDLSASGGNMSFSGIAFDPLWRAELLPVHVLFSVATMCATCVVASLYPAVKAARLDPIRAMTHV